MRKKVDKWYVNYKYIYINICIWKMKKFLFVKVV